MINCCDNPEWFVWGHKDGVATCKSCHQNTYDKQKIREIKEEQSDEP